MRPLLASSLLLPLLACSAPSKGPQDAATPVAVTRTNELDGRSFPGSIRARGIAGLFGVDGTLSFSNGELTWEAQGSRDTAPYEAELVDGQLLFQSLLPADDGTSVAWSGTFDGVSLRDVEARWSRATEEDAVHDFFLGDVVTLDFTPTRD